MKDASIVEWLGLAATVFVFGFGGAAAWFLRHERDVMATIVEHKKAVQERIEEAEKRLQQAECQADDVQERVHGHETKLAVVAACQENTSKHLDQIHRVTGDINSKLDGLIKTLLEERGS